MKPVRIIKFECEGRFYRFQLDLDLEYEKASAINEVLEMEDGIVCEVQKLKKNIYRLNAEGVVRPMAMRNIFNILSL
jgi:hypothetical protein